MKKQAHSTYIRDLLEEAVLKYNRPGFIEDDPISVPHLFTKKEDREISGFFAATLAWGQRKTILTNATRIVHVMDMQPHDFVLHHSAADLKAFVGFVHRTFNDSDLLFFIQALRNVYTKNGGLEALFAEGLQRTGNMNDAIGYVKDVFFDAEHLPRSRKHVSDPRKGSAAKRLHMYLRWMVRKDDAGVDFGIWNSIAPSLLMPPLDLHSGRVARRLELLTRTQDDRRAVEELYARLAELDPGDPAKYDFALYGLGVFEKIK